MHSYSCAKYICFTLAVLTIGLYEWLKASNINTNQVKEIEVGGGISLSIVLFLFHLPHTEQILLCWREVYSDLTVHPD